MLKKNEDREEIEVTSDHHASSDTFLPVTTRVSAVQTVLLSKYGGGRSHVREAMSFLYIHTFITNGIGHA